MHANTRCPGGTKKVARHEMPGKQVGMTRRERYDPGRSALFSPRQTHHLAGQILPYPTGRAYNATPSRHFMPGYLHGVPTG
jgi:hypothetical protein